MNKILIFILLLISTALPQSNWWFMWDSGVTPTSYLMNPSGDSVKGHWILDPVYASQQGKSYFTKNYATGRTDSLWVATADTSAYAYNILTGGMVQKMGTSTERYSLDTTSASYLNPNNRSLTIEMVFCQTAHPTSPNYYVLVGKHLTNGTISYFITSGNDSLLYFKTSNLYASGVSWDALSTTKVARYRWYYIAAVADKDKDSIYIYVNGVLEDKDSYNSDSLNVGNSFCLGGLEPTSTHRFNGYIAETRLSHRALTNTEIANHWNKIKDINPGTPSIPSLTLAQSSTNVVISATEKEMMYLYKGTVANPTTLLTTLGNGVGSFTDTNITLGQTYYYRAKNFRGDFNGNLYSSDYSIDYTITPSVDSLLKNTVLTALWAESDALITKTASGDSVEIWGDKSGNNRSFTQSTATKKPIWSSTGVLFDGVNDWMTTDAFTLNRPYTIYLVIKQKTWQSGDYFIDGKNVASCGWWQTVSSPNIVAQAGSDTANVPNFPLDTYGLLYFNVAASAANCKIQYNNDPIRQKNLGAGGMGGVTLASYGTGIAYWANIEIKAIIIRTATESDKIIGQIKDYLNTKYSIY